MPNQNGIDVIAALLSDQTEWIEGDPEPSVESGENKIVYSRFDFCKSKNATFSKHRIKYLPLNTIYKVGKKIVLYIKSVSSIRYNQDEIILKISVLTLARNLQFFTCHQLVRFSDRHEWSELSFQWLAPKRS